MNLYVLKKSMALLIMAFLPLIAYVVVSVMGKGFLWALVGAFGGMGLSFIIASLMLVNPFTDILEGKGVLFMDLTSTGVIRTFICAVVEPQSFNDYKALKGKLGESHVEGFFDRIAVWNFKKPVKAGVVNSSVDTKNVNAGGLDISINENDYNKSRFVLDQYPVFLYNSQIKSIVTKDFLSNQEKENFIEHSVLYLNQETRRLGSDIRDFARYVVESLRPGLFKGNWVWIIIIGAIILIVAMFFPKILALFQGKASAVTNTVNQTLSNVPQNTVVQRI